MARLRFWLALTAMLIVLGIAPASAASAASARLVDPTLAPATVRPGGSVTVTMTADYEVPESTCLAFLDRRPLLDISECERTYETLSPTSDAATGPTSPS